MNNKQVWDRQAEEWKEVFYPIKGNSILNWIMNLGKKTDKILDQGCGVGQYALTIYKLGFHNVIGLDFSKNLLSIAKENAKKLNYKVKFVKGDIRAMPFKPESFHILVSAGIIEHVPETEKAVSELSRVTKKGGYLLLHVPYKIATFTLLKKVQQALGIWKLGYEKSFTQHYMLALLKKYNFKIIEIKRTEFKAGKHKLIGKLIQLIDKPLYLLGFGGHHIHFFCQKT